MTRWQCHGGRVCPLGSSDTRLVGLSMVAGNLLGSEGFHGKLKSLRLCDGGDARTCVAAPSSCPRARCRAFQSSQDYCHLWEPLEALFECLVKSWGSWGSHCLCPLHEAPRAPEMLGDKAAQLPDLSLQQLLSSKPLIGHENYRTLSLRGRVHLQIMV